LSSLPRRAHQATSALGRRWGPGGAWIRVATLVRCGSAGSLRRLSALRHRRPELRTLTLILTLLRPGEGIWRTVDARITRGGQLEDDFAVKSLSLHCWDGTVVVSHTGLAEYPPTNDSMFDWVRSTLRGESRGLEASLLHLQTRLNRDISSSRNREIRRAPLVLAMAGVVGTRPDLNSPLQNRRMGAWAITNLSWPSGLNGQPIVEPQFHLEGGIISQAAVAVMGSGRGAVLGSQSDMELLRRATTHRPRRPEDYLGLLAAINRRAAPRSGNTVSPWCESTFIPESGQNLQSKAFNEHGDPEPPVLHGMPTILFGVDLTGPMAQTINAGRARRRGLPEPPEADPNEMVVGRP